MLLATEFLLGAFLFCPRLVDDWRVATAVANYHRNPTQETKATKEKESARLRKDLLIQDLINTGFLALNTLALYLIVKSIRKQHNQPNHVTALPRHAWLATFDGRTMNAKITFGGLLYGAVGTIVFTTLAVCDVKLLRTNMILGLIVFTLLVAGVVFAVLLGQTLFTKNELIMGAVFGYIILIGCIAIRNERNRHGTSAFREGSNEGSGLAVVIAKPI